MKPLRCSLKLYNQYKSHLKTRCRNPSWCMVYYRICSVGIHWVIGDIVSSLVDQRLWKVNKLFNLIINTMARYPMARWGKGGRLTMYHSDYALNVYQNKVWSHALGCACINQY